MAASLNGQQSANALTLTSNYIGSHPEGACNYRELGRNTKSPVCGCKRFWLDANNVFGRPGGDAPAWCFCGHHACFHNAVSQNAQRLVSQQLSTTSQLNQGKAALVAGDHVSLQQRVSTSGLGIEPENRFQSQSQSINTRVWEALNAFARGQDDGEEEITRLPSTVASFNGNTVAAPRPMGPPISIPPAAIARPGIDDCQGSATEIATPSIAGTPDLAAYIPPRQLLRQSPSLLSAPMTSPIPLINHQALEHGQTASPQLMTTLIQQSKTTDVPSVTSEQLLTMLRAHADRLAALESVSFSQGPIDEVQDRLELFDGRLLDLEQWRGEAEEQMNQDEELSGAYLSKNRKRRLLPAEASSFVTEDSFDMAAAAHAEAAVLATIATNAEVGPRIDNLETRVADLERSALPTYAQPWIVQVVLLPWGRGLRGAWFSSEDATQHSMRVSASQTDEWTGAQSQTKTSFASTSSARAWTTESIEAWAQDTQDWLSGKACGPSGVVFQRLASRGFVRNVTFTQPDARHILDTLALAFKEVLVPSELDETNKAAEYMALRQAVIPLRKVRKSARLRFLDQAEMLTPAIWNAHFLDASVVMKPGDGQRRLYITTPDAYIQRNCGGLSWQQIRQMPSRDVNGEIQVAQVDDSVAIEACWSYNDKLDFAASLNTSFASHVSSNSVWSIKSQPPSEHNINIGPLTPALSGPESQQTHKRALSLPESASDKQNNSMIKSRVVSFEAGGKLAADPSKDSNKRPRLSGSQSAVKRGVLFTPRDSKEPISPFESEHGLEAQQQQQQQQQQQAVDARKRGSTQNFYATPYSVDHLEIEGDGDTEHDSADGDRANESEWNGMDLASHAADEELISDVDQSFETNDDDDADDSLYEDDEDMN